MSKPLSTYRRLPKRLPLSLGFTRYCLYFTEENWIYVPHDASLNVPATGISILLWSYVPSGPTTYVALSLFDKRNPGVWDQGYYAYLKPSTLAEDGGWVVLGLGNCTIPNAEFEYDRRVHWAFVWEPADGGVDGTLRVYKYAREISSASVTGSPVHSTEALRIGTRSDGDMKFKGMMDEFVIVGASLTQKEIERAMLNYHSRLNGLRLWFRMEEGTGLTAYDRSGYGNHGTLSPSATPPVWTRVKMWELRTEARL